MENVKIMILVEKESTTSFIIDDVYLPKNPKKKKLVIFHNKALSSKLCDNYFLLKQNPKPVPNKSTPFLFNNIDINDYNKISNKHFYNFLNNYNYFSRINTVNRITPSLRKISDTIQPIGKMTIKKEFIDSCRNISLSETRKNKNLKNYKGNNKLDIKSNYLGSGTMITNVSNRIRSAINFNSRKKQKIKINKNISKNKKIIGYKSLEQFLNYKNEEQKNNPMNILLSAKYQKFRENNKKRRIYSSNNLNIITNYRLSLSGKNNHSPLPSNNFEIDEHNNLNNRIINKNVFNKKKFWKNDFL